MKYNINLFSNSFEDNVCELFHWTDHLKYYLDFWIVLFSAKIQKSTIFALPSWWEEYNVKLDQQNNWNLLAFGDISGKRDWLITCK